MNQSAMGFEARRQWPLWALAAVCLLWLLLSIAAGFNVGAELVPGQSRLAASAILIFPPLIVLLLLLAFIPLGRRSLDIEEVETRVDQAIRSTADLEEQLQRIDGSLADCLDKVERMRAAAAPEGEGLAATALSLEVAAGTMALSSADMGKSAASLLELVPGLTAQAHEAEAALRIAGSEARRHLETIEASLSQVASHGRDAGREAEAMVTSMQNLIAQIDQTSAETTKSIANRAYTLDAAVTGVLERSAQAFSSIGDTLTAQSQSVAQMVEGARSELDGFGSEGTRLIGQRLDVLLGAAGKLKQQFHEQQLASQQLHEAAGAGISAVEARLAALRESQSAASAALVAQADASAQAFEVQLASLGERQRVAEAEQQERMALSLEAMERQLLALGSHQQEQSARMQQAMADAMTDLESRLETLKGRQQAMGAEIEAGVSEMVAAVEGRLDTLRLRQAEVRAELEAEVAGGISSVEQRLAELRARQQELGRAMQEDAAAGLAEVAAKFAELEQQAGSSQRATSETIAQALEEVAGLGSALHTRHEVAVSLAQEIAGLMPSFDSFADRANVRIPELAGGLEQISDRGRALVGQLDSLADRIESQAALLRDSAAAFERDHGAVVGLSETLAGKFDAARATVNEIHEATEQAAIAAASRMVENVMQVRQAVNATSGEIDSLLSSVVAEAEHKLDEFATTKAEAAFGAPIRLQIAALEDASVKAADAATGASERLTNRLIDLMRVIADTESRIDEVDTRMDVRARDTLAARSMRLVESLNSASVDVAKLLAVDVGEDAWARYLQGDRSLFARATVKLADKEMARRIARHYAHDGEFEAEATRYLDQFETLVKRVLKDPDGESFALVLLSSDIGKLYVLIAQSIGRTLPREEAA
ncbi:coiled-coil domain-containing protein [Sandaracinobacteroides hominis]|uniref:hypothetical protein n=1 Tax=Sandaracinobacteroides hominis TaxID=2780086 RepID=UPI0018F3770D|nr:hypothetical protein [Sandaracinobacteroides hominis]